MCMIIDAVIHSVLGFALVRLEDSESTWNLLGLHN